MGGVLDFEWVWRVVYVLIAFESPLTLVSLTLPPPCFRPVVRGGQAKDWFSACGRQGVDRDTVW